jgi:hypothetical protein
VASDQPAFAPCHDTLVDVSRRRYHEESVATGLKGGWAGTWGDNQTSGSGSGSGSGPGSGPGSSGLSAGLVGGARLIYKSTAEGGDVAHHATRVSRGKESEGQDPEDLPRAATV